MRSQQIVWLILIGCLILPFTAVSGQGIELDGVGIKFGISKAKWFGADRELDAAIDEDDEYRYPPLTRNGFAVGGFAVLKVSTSFAVQPELYYVSKGTKYSMPGFDFVFKLDYLELPVLFKFTIPTRFKTRPIFFAGPKISYLMKSELKGRIYDNPGKADLLNVNDIDFGLVFGLGVEIPDQKGRIILDVRYNLGLSKIAGSESQEPVLGKLYLGNNKDIKNRTLMLLAGYAF